MQFRTRLFLIVFLCSKAAIGTAQSVSISIDSIITASSLKALVQTLAADSFQGRLSGTKKATEAALFISEELKNAGALPIGANKDYLFSFQLPVETKNWGFTAPIFNFQPPADLISYNVVAALPGTTKAKEIIIFSAHLDHVGTKKYSTFYQSPEKGNPEETDDIFNGANDNASGISGLIHLARYFAQQPNRERTILFIAFSGEEEGLLGSKELVKTLNTKAIKAMINMDMIGRPLAADKKNPYITGDKYTSLKKLLNKKLFALAPSYGSHYFKGDPFLFDNLFKRSDNYSFARKHIAAHTLMCTSPHDMYYHSLNDEVETLDYPFMAEVVKAIALGAAGLVNGTDTPRKLH
ncbi:MULTISPECIES: M28 family metallopeptidase [Niastella]|uniref:M20/M25/M40 family metallo-hydrolase n=1 Tax=Niastella soli TaxID=2821487 RepID=A0ABS3YMV2_9BACT|nr:M28 family peptidase [Niastella soli]MBO9199179.1 M20/M25/M40 family metallo-hydrolase [Niastella soli]